jgi:hypothetical protein
MPRARPHPCVGIFRKARGANCRIYRGGGNEVGQFQDFTGDVGKQQGPLGYHRAVPELRTEEEGGGRAEETPGRGDEENDLGNIEEES